MFNTKKKEDLARALRNAKTPFDMTKLNNCYIVWCYHPTMQKFSAKKLAKLLASAKEAEIRVYVNTSKKAQCASNNIPYYYA